MRIANGTPFPHHAMPVMGPGDEPILSIVLKGTFAIEPDQPGRPAEEQEPIAFAPELSETERGALPVRDDDLAPFKPRTDVLLIGRAHAPGGKPAAEFDVRLRVGSVNKTVRVFGERRWEAGRLGGEPKIGPPAPFREVELGYALAFGGMDTVRGGAFTPNPVGIGFLAEGTKRKDVVGARLPRLEDPAHLVTRWKDRPGPAAFGCLARGWEPRARHLGTWDERWKRERSPLPPADFSYDFHQSVAADQQVEGYLRGDEPFQLVHATPAGRLAGRLPGVRPVVGVVPSAGTVARPVRMVLDTLVLLPEDSRMLLVWRGCHPIPTFGDPAVGRITIELESP